MNATENATENATATRPAFHTWTFGGVQYLAVWSGHNFHVTNERGENFGGHRSVEEFRKFQRAGDSLANPLEWRATVRVQVDPPAGWR